MNSIPSIASHVPDTDETELNSSINSTFCNAIDAQIQGLREMMEVNSQTIQSLNDLRTCAEELDPSDPSCKKTLELVNTETAKINTISQTILEDIRQLELKKPEYENKQWL